MQLDEKLYRGEQKKLRSCTTTYFNNLFQYVIVCTLPTLPNTMLTIKILIMRIIKLITSCTC